MSGSSVTGRSGGASSGVSFCSGKSAPKLGEQTCTAAPLSTIVATAESVLRSVRVTDATTVLQPSLTKLPVPVARLVLVVVCTLVPAALETIVAHSLGHIIYHIVVDCTAPHSSVVVAPVASATLYTRTRQSFAM